MRGSLEAEPAFEDNQTVATTRLEENARLPRTKARVQGRPGDGEVRVDDVVVTFRELRATSKT
jgi:hypothetical protein